MSSAQPEISVIISTYNDRDLVPKKLAEIEGQTYFSRAEFIFVEPNSPGNERELLEPFCEKHENCRLIARGERINLYQAWNLGWAEARAELVCISNMDDAMHPELLEVVSTEMNQHEWGVASVLIAKQKYDERWNSWDPERLKRLKLITRPGAFFVWRNDLKDDFGMFDEALEIVADKDFWARVVARNVDFGLIPRVLYLHTYHAQQLSKVGDAKEKKDTERALCQAKGYKHEWPLRIRVLVRIYRLLRFLPFCRSQFYSNRRFDVA